MDAGLAAIIAGFIGAVAAIVGAAITLRASAQANKESVEYQLQLARLGQEEAERMRRHEYLVSLMQQVIDAAGEYETYLGRYQENSDKNDAEAMIRHAQIIGKAMAACLAAHDSVDEKNDKGSRRTYHDCLENPGGDEKAYRDCVDQFKNRLSFIARRRLTRNFVSEPSWMEVKVFGDYKNRNRAALIDAVERFGELISSIT